MSAVGNRSWEEIQIKAFTYWTNGYLSEEDAVSNLEKDFTDGLRLIHLVEILTSTHIKRYKKNPSIRAHYIENVNLALQHLSRLSDVRLGAVAEDFVDGNLKAILGFLWSLLRHFRVEKQSDEGTKGSSLEESLLVWLRDVLQGYNLPMNSITSTYKDGRVLSALLHKHDPSLIDYENLDPKNSQENLQNAIELLEKHVNVPILLNAKQILSEDVDERSLVLYTSLIQRAFTYMTETHSVNVEKENITCKLEEMETKLAYLRGEHESISKFKDDLERGFEKTKAEAADWKAKYEMQKVECEELQNRLNSTVNRQQYLEEKVAVLEETAASQSDEKLELEAKFSKLESSVQTLKEESVRLENEKIALQVLVDELQRKEEASRREFDQVRQERDRIVNQYKNQASLNNDGLSVLRKNLVRHLEDLHEWKGILDKNERRGTSSLIQAQAEREFSESVFEEQLQYLSSALNYENKKIEQLLDIWKSESSGVELARA